ncbi:MAG: hypothetical protein JKX85_15970 [Phycisphaeraceae bacterium]|nr:hypothetical protein [Phycisphaeraceae bacterium]
MTDKPTKLEKESRIDRVLQMLVAGSSKSEIKKMCRSSFGVSARTAERYLSSARNILIEELDEPREVLIARSLGLYRSVVSDNKSSTINKLRAQKRVDKIMGLESPLKHEITGKDGKPIQQQIIDPQHASKIASDPALAAAAQTLGVAMGLPTGVVDEDESE